MGQNPNPTDETSDVEYEELTDEQVENYAKRSKRAMLLSFIIPPLGAMLGHLHMRFNREEGLSIGRRRGHIAIVVGWGLTVVWGLVGMIGVGIYEEVNRAWEQQRADEIALMEADERLELALSQAPEGQALELSYLDRLISAYESDQNETLEDAVTAVGNQGRLPTYEYLSAVREDFSGTDEEFLLQLRERVEESTRNQLIAQAELSPSAGEVDAPFCEVLVNEVMPQAPGSGFVTEYDQLSDDLLAGYQDLATHSGTPNQSVYQSYAAYISQFDSAAEFYDYDIADHSEVADPLHTAIRDDYAGCVALDEDYFMGFDE